MMDLVSKAVGGRVVAFNDAFFATAENLLVVSAPVWKEDEYTGRGKWMDGWETRRRREPGHDWCIVALGVPGRLRKVTVDTSHFTGNYPESFSVEACGVGSDEQLQSAQWAEMIPRTELEGDSVAEFRIDNPHRVTYLRLNIYPDGGVARLRVEGDPIPSIAEVCPEEGKPDLVSAIVGGDALDASDVHYSPPSNLLRPTAPAGMWDGWETRRRRGPGHEWATFRLGMPGQVEILEVDTRYFKGNSPGWVSFAVSDDGEEWSEIVTRQEVAADSVNTIVLSDPVRARFARLDIHPDGGLARLRVRGAPEREAMEEKRIAYLNSLFGQAAVGFFHATCTSSAWIESMLAGRPYSNVESVMVAATDAFESLDESDWLEAFAGHSRIGERGDRVADREQSGVAEAQPSVRDALAEANREYEQRFGFTYIVYASGKTAEEMLEIARERLGNERSEEIVNAADQQRSITATRLRLMLCQGAS